MNKAKIDYIGEYYKLKEKYKYPLLKFSAKELAKTYGITHNHYLTILREANINVTNEIREYLLSLDTKNLTADEISYITKLSITTVRKYLKLLHLPYKKIYIKTSKCLKYAEPVIDNLYKIYEFPILRLGRQGIANKLKCNIHTTIKILDKLNLSKKKELKELFIKYPTDKYTVDFIKEKLKVSRTTAYRWGYRKVLNVQNTSD